MNPKCLSDKGYYGSDLVLNEELFANDNHKEQLLDMARCRAESAKCVFCILCNFVFFLQWIGKEMVRHRVFKTKWSKHRFCMYDDVWCMIVYDNGSQWPCVLCVFVSFYQSLIWPGKTRHVFCVFLYFSQVQGQTTNVLYVFLCFFLQSSQI